MKETVKIEKEPEDNAASAYSVTAESYSKMRYDASDYNIGERAKIQEAGLSKSSKIQRMAVITSIEFLTTEGAPSHQLLQP